MCRLLMIKAEEEFHPKDYIKKFARMAFNSKEYQGDGWGVAWLNGESWKVYKSEKPIWEDSYENISNTSYLLVHARSAFNNTGPDIESTMPFINDNKLFIFNGELRKVRIKSRGNSGAEKLFNFILRLNNGNLYETINRVLSIVEKKTEYIRASNFIIIDEFHAYLVTYFNEDTEYFTMHKKQENKKIIVCSEPIDKSINWQKILNRTVEVI